MIGGLKPYPEYKDSKMLWFDQMPSHWSSRRMKYAFSESVRKGYAKEPLLAATQTRGVVRKADYGKRTVTASKDLHLLKLVEVDDFVISLRSFEGGIEIAHDRGIISPAYTVLRPRAEIIRGYYARFLKSPTFVARLGLFVTGIREGQNIDYVKLSRAYLPLPPLEEQEAIVRFLDWANGRLERAIRAKRKVIALLNEQKQAIIHRAVTRGLDPDVPLKPSGIPWLGDIPQHWKLTRIKQASKILRGKFSHRPRNDASLYGGKYPFIQTGAVARAGKYIKSYTQTLNDRGLAVSKLFSRGTLCMTIAANIGEVAILDFDACFPDSVVGFYPREGLLRDFLYFVFGCLKPELLRDAPINTQGNLNIERIGPIVIPLPDSVEQQQITEWIESKTLPIEAAISRSKEEIKLLREYQTRLISNVVTGKLDVREAAACLPVEAEPETVEADEAEFGPEESEEEASL